MSELPSKHRPDSYNLGYSRGITQMLPFVKLTSFSESYRQGYRDGVIDVKEKALTDLLLKR